MILIIDSTKDYSSQNFTPLPQIITPRSFCTTTPPPLLHDVHIASPPAPVPHTRQEDSVGVAAGWSVEQSLRRLFRQLFFES